MNKLSVGGSLNTLNDFNRSVFSWLVRPLLFFLWPRRDAWLVKNLANIISTARLFASIFTIFFLVYPAYVQQDYTKLYFGLGVMFVLLASDGIDGAIARGLDCTSSYGKAIDPLADKVFYLCSVVAAMIGARDLVHNQVIFSMLVVIIPVVYYEIRLIMIAVATERECLRREAAEPVGANTWGKTKFGLQGLAVFVVFGSPWPTLGLSLAISLMALSLPLAHFSLRGHQLDLEAIKLKPFLGSFIDKN